MTLEEFIEEQLNASSMRHNDFVTIKFSDDTVVGFATAEDILYSEADYLNSEYLDYDKDDVTEGYVIIIANDMDW